jgi:hypothetical protein
MPVVNRVGCLVPGMTSSFSCSTVANDRSSPRHVHSRFLGIDETLNSRQIQGQAWLPFDVTLQKILEEAQSHV